ncbi:hypothetical protein HUU59_10630 [bacterium]|nr:hypothetical protein [bacterium]
MTMDYRRRPMVFSDDTSAESTKKITKNKAETLTHLELNSQLVQSIVVVATALWRIQTAINRSNSAADDLTIKIARHVDVAIESLKNAKVELRAYTDEPYTSGMAVNILAIQPTADVTQDTVGETVKPTIYFRDYIVQRADVIVFRPENQSTTAMNSSENKDGDQSKETNLE